MSNCVSFQNKGLIDVRAVRTFGANSKENVNPIGYFGTGLKYAIAITLRTGGKFTLWRGLMRYEFTLRDTRIRVNDFKVVYMGQRELGFTSELGKNWETWEAFREIYCNTKDEHGDCGLGEFAPKTGYTTVVVEHPDFVKSYGERERIVLEGAPWLKLAGVDIHQQPSKYVYYRGVRVFTLAHESDYTYNIIKECTLTENRTLGGGDYVIQRVIREASLYCADTTYLHRLLTAPEERYEGRIDWTWENAPMGPAFAEVAASLVKHDGFNKSAHQYYRKKKGAGSSEPRACAHTALEATQVAEGVELCRLLGYHVDAVAIVITADLPNNTLGQYVRGIKKLFIARACLAMGAQMVAGTLLEEFLHCEYGLLDESRGMQNHLFNALANAAVALRSLGYAVPKPLLDGVTEPEVLRMCVDVVAAAAVEALGEVDNDCPF